jgi:valyl-tRNA synthetase
MELSKNYIPSSTEDKWSAHWLDKRYFNSQPDGRPAFTVVIPPPNVTGVLHMGHTLNETVQDILVRRARMSGFNACWVPGSDHASIATEAKVVGMLKERGIDKNSLSREKFMEYAYEWKEKYGGIIYHQIKKLGCSVDWDRVSFTMDTDYYAAVIRVFTDLYRKGLIYRGARMINWDPEAKTALSDEEVEYKEIQGKLYHVKYRLVNADGGELADWTPAGPEGSDAGGAAAVVRGAIVIATQRPETIMGDTAICVNPSDERYRGLAGKFAIVPLVNRKVPIIFDEYVDPAFGTGALKVTPAHDINDYNLGLKHGLPVIDTLNSDGTLSEAAEVFVGMDRFAARKKVVEQLRAEGLMLKEEDYSTRLGFSQRTNAVVEPRISTQWFVRMKEMAGPALQAVVEGHITIHPGDKFLATYKYWLENVKDWCISRQLWWGQRIPAWYAPDGSFQVAATREEAFEAFGAAAQGRGEGLGAAAAGAGSAGSNGAAGTGFSAADLRQDDDVLDTWFSSWLWPMEVFKGITNPGNPDIRYYYPTSVLVTGQDIIFFWVARMIMAGLYEFKEDLPIEKRIPFRDVYFTGMVRDKQGRKMSKSLGNSPDLLALIDKYGADAVRFGIMISSPAGNDLLFDEAALEQGRNFNNKLWNALKLVKMVWKVADHGNIEQPKNAKFATLWFRNKLNEAAGEINKLCQNFRLSEALKLLYSLIWDDFCSWYLEWVKPDFGQSIDFKTYDETLKYFEELMQLLHAFMPFITEEIYHLLKERDVDDDICIKQFNNANNSIDQKVLIAGELAKNNIATIRDLRSKLELKSKEITYPKIKTDDPTRYEPIKEVILKMTSSGSLDFVSESIPQAIGATSGSDMIYLPVLSSTTATTTTLAGQRKKLEDELDHHKGFLKVVLKKLNNEQFVQHAKPEVVEMERKKQSDAEAKIKAIEESLANLN